MEYLVGACEGNAKSLVLYLTENMVKSFSAPSPTFLWICRAHRSRILTQKKVNNTKNGKQTEFGLHCELTEANAHKKAEKRQ